MHTHICNTHVNMRCLCIYVHAHPWLSRSSPWPAHACSVSLHLVPITWTCAVFEKCRKRPAVEAKRASMLLCPGSWPTWPRWPGTSVTSALSRGVTGKASQPFSLPVLGSHRPALQLPARLRALGRALRVSPRSRPVRCRTERATHTRVATSATPCGRPPPATPRANAKCF